MSYYAYDLKGYVGDAASNGGWYRFAKWLREQPEGSEMRFLGEEGCCDEPATLAKELKAAHLDDVSDESLRKNFIDLASKANGILVISNTA